MSHFWTINLGQIPTVLEGIVEYTKLFVFLIKKDVKHMLWKLYIWRENNKNLEIPMSLFNFLLFLSNFLLPIMPHTLLHAFYIFGGFYVLYFQKFMKYLQFENAAFIHWYNYVSCFALHSFTNNSYHCGWFLTTTDGLVRLSENWPKSSQVLFPSGNSYTNACHCNAFLSMCILVQLFVMNLINRF